MIEVEEFLREDGTSPFQNWFMKLDAQAASKITTALLRLELGNTSAIKWFSGLGELRIDWGPGYRVYLIKDGDALIVLFGGGTKSMQQKDVEKSKALIHEYKIRKKALVANKAAKSLKTKK